MSLQESKVRTEASLLQFRSILCDVNPARHRQQLPVAGRCARTDRKRWGAPRNPGAAAAKREPGEQLSRVAGMNTASGGEETTKHECY